MKKSTLIFAVAIIATAYALSVSALEKTKPEESNNGDIKTVAWYVANIKEARAKNKECFADPNNKELQSTPNCANSLQALKMSFAVNN